MMVTFVSQCQKKALNRTRRVLDAFANRIGDNTWQTIITEDGLIAVKTLLRKTATKNTAVSCHWIRSRSRSELVWIVGNRDQFNPEGIVPVNFTFKELIMDIPSDKPNPNMLYANTQLQSLIEHLFAVGYVAEQLHKRLMPNQEKQSTATFVAGCLHDFGKIDPCFQDWVRNPKKKDFVAEDGQHIDDAKFSFDKHPRHNEISVLLYHLLDHVDLKETVSNPLKTNVKHAIYWHHTKPFRKEKEKEFTYYRDIHNKLANSLNGIEFSELIEKSKKLLKNVCETEIKYINANEARLAKIFNENDRLEIFESTQDKIELPSYKDYLKEENIEKYHSRIKWNAENNIIRACVISADRWVSKLTALELHTHIKNGSLDTLLEDSLSTSTTLCSQIETCLSSSFFSPERSKKQSEIAHELIKAQKIPVLAGPAGCGKTKIALEWAKLKNAQQLIWVCPRVQVCQGLFRELISEKYLPNAQIEINTGEFKFTKEWGKATPEEDYFSGDIVLTTIDQIFSGIISHNKVDTLINFLDAHVVFDEFHEYINMPAFNLLFAELIACKQQQELGNTLLVSATPHYFYLRQVLQIEPEDIVKMPSFNQSQYRIEFREFDETTQDDNNPLYKFQNTNTIVISNTATTAQKSFIRNQHENSVLLHSKFKKSDKQKWFDEVLESFQKDGTQKFDVLRSGPIVQASLNITCNYMISEMTSAENMLQRLGRLDRFGNNLEQINVLTIAITGDVIQGKSKGNSSRFLNSMHTLQSAKAWYQFFKAKIDDQSFTLPQLYELYEEFHESDNGKKSIESDLTASLKKSVDLINHKVIDPITIPPKKVQAKGRAKISKGSLRGENRFVQMAVYDVNKPNDPFRDQYAYQMPINERDDFDNLTASKDEIEGYGDSDKNLLAYMKNKHHNIMGGTKAYKDFILLNEARDPEFPVYLSYTPNDLLQVGGESARHSYAIYYAVCDKQPIGAISIKQLNSNEE
ncbi:MAG: CRISPR-associated endonuclease Cas3'' [Methylobacter sp.]|uniref:CRISPR-associated endonuclease Cas3'' n=1 Tax=Methylobacter sp. TaxID=2051955 RepID=UPI0027315B75|nr:CRISPR-associated endonuclease Cas3'' [Methylobacter sp.]MDP1664893.1 CRISPR-associated endonuclease Cas3'' [Methylobacter sp.]